MSKALKAAIEANDPVAAQKALKTVKDLSRKLPKTDPPLPYACARGADAVVEVLIHAGAPIPISGYEGNHPFCIAAENGHTKVIDALARHNVPENVASHALFIATLADKETVVE